MMDGRFLKALGALLLFAAVLIPRAAYADHVRPSCWAEENRVALDAEPEVPPANRWICDGRSPSDTPGTAWLFYTPADFALHEQRPTHFVTDEGRFERIVMITMNADGPVRSRSYRMGDASHVVNGPKFALPIPDMFGATGLVVAIEKPWSPKMMSQARLQTRFGPTGALGWSNRAMLFLAILIGLLAVPLAYNLAFYRLLKERFVLWMLASEASLLGFVIVSSGLLDLIFHVDMALNLVLASLGLLAPLIFGTGFFLAYLEEDVLSETMRNLLMSTALATGMVGVFFCLPLPFLRPFAHSLFIGAPIPLFLAVIAASAKAVRAGSSAIWFQIPACLALTVAALAIIVRNLGMGYYTNWPDYILYTAIFAHVAVASAAVMYRVDIMRRERERVNARLESLTSLIDLDPLTGIFNRRALEHRFAELRSDGFHALAVVDLDHFKRINDRFGHTTGDRVLQEVAAVLASDKDAIAFRLGGEEFVVMLRGAQIQQRAEQLRRAITIRIANEVDGIDGPVTASMGLIESPPGGTSTMRQLYSQADRLLYEAKYSGRNRMISERIQVFEPPSRERRAKDRRQNERRTT